MINVTPAIKGFTATFTPSSELDVVGYVIHASTTQGFTPSVSNLVSTGPSTSVYVKVPYTGNVYVRAAAYDSFEDLANINYSGLNYSAEQIVLVNQTNPLDNVAPPTPTGVGAVGAVDITGQTDTATITVSWNAVTDTDLDLDGYSILLKVGTATTYTEFNTGKAYTSYKIANLTPATDYSVCVASYDKWGNLSAYSSWVTVLASALKDTSVPAAPTSVLASGGFDTIAVTITATKPTDWANYEIQLATNVGFTAGLQTVISTASVTTIKASAGTYYVRARCRDRADNASASWTNSTTFPVSTALTLPSSLYNELRTDFLVNNVLFKFGRTGDASYPTDTSLYVVSSSGALIWKNSTYTIATTTLTNAYNSYILATCSGATATLSVAALTTDLTALASNVVVIAVTSPSKQPDTNGNYICYVRNGNSLELEGVLIRNASISTAQIGSLDIGSAVVSGTLSVNRLGASSLTADKFAAGVMGNICAGRTVGGTGGASTIPTDGTKTIGSGWYGFGTGSQNNNAIENSYVEIDLGVPRKLGKIELYFYYPDERYYYYKVKYSTDGATWYYAAGTSANTGWVTSPATSGLTTGSVLPTVIQLPSIQTAKYIRVYGNGNSVNTTNGVYEIEAYEYGVYITGAQIMTGSLSAATEVLVGTDAAGTIKLSGTNNRIEVRKAGEAFDRVQIGKLSTGDYGIVLKNADGDALFTSDGSIDGAKVKNLYVNGNAVIGGTVTIGGANLTYSDGSTLDALKPANAGATATYDLVLKPSGTCTVVGNTISKPTGVALWDSQVASTDGYTGGCCCSFVVKDTTKALMIGINTNPNVDSNYTSIDYAWYLLATGGGGIYENGVNMGTPISALSVGDVLSITYDGSNVRYLQNGIIKRTISTTAGRTFYLDSSFLSVGGYVSNVKFYPMSSNNWSDIGGTNKPSDNADSTSGILGSVGTLTLNAALTINSLLTVSGSAAGITSGLTSYNQASTTGFWISKGTSNARMRCGTTNASGAISNGFMWDGTGLTVAGNVQSANYVAGTSGWKLASDGTADFVTANIIDDVNIASGAVTIGAVTGDNYPTQTNGIVAGAAAAAIEQVTVTVPSSYSTQKFLVQYSVRFPTNSETAQWVYVYRGGTSLFSTKVGIDSNGERRDSFFFVDTPGVGTFTYYLKYQVVGGTGTFYGNASLAVVAFKK